MEYVSGGAAWVTLGLMLKRMWKEKNKENVSWP